MSVKGDARTLFWVVRIRYRNFSGPFLVYMLVLYNKIRKLNQIFPVKPIPAALMHEIIEKNGLPFCDDANNTVIVHKQFLSECGVGGFMKIGGSSRLVYVIGTKTEQNFALVTHDLDVNLKRKQVKLQPIQRLRVATEITISLVSIPHDLGNFSVDTLVKNYFHTPKIVTRGDVIAVDFKKYAPEIFYTQLKWNDVGVVFFKCNKIHYKNQEMKSAVCKIGETAIKQSANVQSFVAPASKIFTFYFDDNTDYDDRMIDSCPWGLKTHLEALERAVRPFLTKNKVRLKLAFLLQGKKGVGKKEIVASLAAKLGLHLFSVTSGEVSASVYAQTETKIRNVFFRTRLCSPCILCIDNFENFGRNNEGQHDERIMSFFETQLETLFSNNAFPIILICASNTKDVPQQLSRAFLEIFEVPAPSQAQRLDLLRWIFEKNCLTGCNIERAAEKTQGFLFEDLQALIFHARRDSGGWGIFTDRDVDNALDLMQARHNQSLGAPRVPKVQWSDVGGLAEVKEEIIRTINLPLRHPELLKSSGLRRSGILLYGPPGTGKTLLAKAVATECNLCFLSVKGPELLNMYVGQSEQNVREVFERAREASPCIIFFDELDSLAPNRGVSGDSGGVMDRVVSQLLAEMDGLSQSATIFIIGATNRPDLIDPALLRPGRFDKLLYVGPCVDLKSKVGVLKALTRKFKLRDVDLEEVVKVCPPNITGADFYGLCSNAWMSAARRVIWRIENEGLKDATQDDVQVTMDDFQAALKDLKPSIRAEDLMYFEKLERQFSKTKT